MTRRCGRRSATCMHCDIDNEFLYTGRRLDPETGLQQSRYRYYHAQLGRFVNRDLAEYTDANKNDITIRPVGEDERF